MPPEPGSEETVALADAQADASWLLMTVLNCFLLILFVFFKGLLAQPSHIKAASLCNGLSLTGKLCPILPSRIP